MEWVDGVSDRDAIELTRNHFEPLGEKLDQFAWGAEPCIRSCWSVSGPYQNGKPASLESPEGIFIRNIVAKEGDLCVWTRLSENGSHRISFVRMRGPQLQTTVELQQ